MTARLFKKGPIMRKLRIFANDIFIVIVIAQAIVGFAKWFQSIFEYLHEKRLAKKHS